MYPVIVHKNIIVKGDHGRDILLDVHVPGGDQNFPVVIFSHGFKGFKDWGPFNQMAFAFAEAGFILVKFNFSFNGTTPEEPLDFVDLDAFGNNNFTKELDDLNNVIDWVSSPIPPFSADLNHIHLLGHSRGGGITIIKAAEDKRIASVATWAAVADFSGFITGQDIDQWKESGVHLIENARTGQMMPLYLQLYFDFIENEERLGIKQAARRLSVPLLVLHGTSDETVPLSHAIGLHRHNAEMVELITIPGADHTFGTMHPFTEESLPPLFQEVVDKTIRFFKAH